MDQYIPPLYAVAFGLIAVFSCFIVRIPFFILGILALALVVYAAQDHIYRFGGDYSSFSAPSFFSQNASTLIIVVVIVLSLGFLLLKFGPRTVQQNEPSYYNYGNDSESWYSRFVSRNRNKIRSLPFNSRIL